MSSIESTLELLHGIKIGVCVVAALTFMASEILTNKGQGVLAVYAGVGADALVLARAVSIKLRRGTSFL